jgi:DNA adenine methylase
MKDTKSFKNPLFAYKGNKRRLLPRIIELLPQEKNVEYVEPFLGTGIVALNVSGWFKSATINDTARPLIELYRSIIANPEEVYRSYIETYHAINCKEIFYERLALYNSDAFSCKLQKSGLFLALMQLCFRGRFLMSGANVNLGAGWFGEINDRPNQPSNRKKTLPYALTALSSFQLGLTRATILSDDFGAVIGSCTSDAFIFADPPYMKSALGVKSGYGGGGENANTLNTRLRDDLVKHDARGGKFMITGNNTQQLSDMYKGFKQITASVSSFANFSGVNPINEELIIINY